MMMMTRMMMRHITHSQDYNGDSQVDPEFRPTRRELKEADKEGDL